MTASWAFATGTTTIEATTMRSTAAIIRWIVPVRLNMGAGVIVWRYLVAAVGWA